MTAESISGKEKWERAHIELNTSLEREIHLMREILASLHQEELALLESDFRRFDQIMSERSDFVMKIGKQRQERMDSTACLTKIAVQQQRVEILPAEEASSCDVLTKLDQLIALSERINLQNCRNDALFDQAKHKQALPLECPYPHPLHSRPMSKPKVATDLQKP